MKDSKPFVIAGERPPRPYKLDKYVRILSIFQSFDGEQNIYGMGMPATFIRLAGCVGINCVYCDTKYSWDPRNGRDMTVEGIVLAIDELQRGAGGKVTITGGEPLQQDGMAFRSLVEVLIEFGHALTVETAGTEDLSFLLQSGASVVADYKLPSSGARKVSHNASLIKMSGNHFIKMVVGDEEDLVMARDTIRWLRNSGCGAKFVLGPVLGDDGMSLGKICDYILRSQDMREAGVGVNYQLHKIMYPDQFRDEEEGGHDFTKEKS